MITFATIRPEQIRTDCRYYTGYKPCGMADGCPGCTKYRPRGRERLIITGKEDPPSSLHARVQELRTQHPGDWITCVTSIDRWQERVACGADEVLPSGWRSWLRLNGRDFAQVTGAGGGGLPEADRGEAPAAFGARDEPAILIIKLGAMGDVLRTKCLLPGLRERLPDCRIIWLTEKGSEAIVRDPLVDEILTLSDVTASQVRARRFRLLLCLDKDPEALALSRMIPASRKLGYGPTRYNTATVWNRPATYALRLGLSDHLKYDLNQQTHPEILYGMAELPYSGQSYGLQIPEEERQKARRRLEMWGLAPEHRLVGVNTGCGPVFRTKQWSMEGFEGLIRGLCSEKGISVLLFGGPREETLHDELRDRCGDLLGRRFFDTGNDNSLEEFFALVEQVEAMVSSDSLAMHVGIALRKKVVALFGPTCHQEVDLYGRGTKLITDYPCSPCYLKICGVRPTCVEAMSADTALRAVLGLLRSDPAPR